MVKNQSILDVLKELDDLSHIVIKDPEDEDFESGRISTFDEVADENAAADKSFGNLRKTTQVDGVVDKKYAGVKGSRKSLSGWSDDSESDIEMASDDEEDEDGDDRLPALDDSNMESDTEAIDGSDNEIPIHDHVKHAETSSDVENFYDPEDDDIPDNTMHIDPSLIPDDLKGKAIKTIPKVDENDIANFTANAVDDDVLKGQSTKAQLDILDKLLESRIRLQKSLHLCNQLPQDDIMCDFREQAGPQIKESYESAKMLVKEVLTKLLNLQEVLCETNCETSSILTSGNVTAKEDSDEEIPSDTEDEEEDENEKKANNIDQTNKKESLNLPSKRKHTLSVMDYGEEITKRHKALQPFQESVINKWYEKTRLASGNISSKNFASFDKSVMQQIKQVLLDKGRLIKRTQLSRVPLNILGKQITDVSEEMTENVDKTDLHLKDYNENIFDDGDFYHEMLKELIERKSNINSDDPIAAGRRWLELQKLRTKIKRKVDTRASKGRKVRYDVHPKLVNFMSPQDAGSMSDQARNDLFASLFGKNSVIPCR